MTADFDAVLAELKKQLANYDLHIADAEQTLADERIKYAACEGEIEGMERARELLGPAAVATMPNPEPPAPRERHSVQRAVMALFDRSDMKLWTEAEIITASGLPLMSVHEYLLRAVRQGKLRVEGGVYSLPRTLSEEVAELRRVMPAEETLADQGARVDLYGS